MSKYIKCSGCRSFCIVERFYGARWKMIKYGLKGDDSFNGREFDGKEQGRICAERQEEGEILTKAEAMSYLV